MRFGKLIGLIALLIALYLLWKIRVVVLLAFSAVAIATLLNRIVRKLVRWQLQRGVAIALTLVTISTAVAIILRITVPPFVDQVTQWLDRVPLEVAQISGWLQTVDDQIPIELTELTQQLDTFVRDIPRVLRSVFSNFFLLFRGTFALVVNSLLVLIVTIMLLANPQAYRQTFTAVFPKFYRHRIKDILDKCEQSLVAWGIGILFNMMVITVLSFIGLRLIDVPLPIGNAFAAGLLTFIPNVGPVLSVVPPAILGLLEAPWKAVAVLILYVVIQQIESNLLTPLVMKRQVSLLPAITLISQLICGILFGFLGLFLALPIVVIGQVWIQELLIEDIMNGWEQKKEQKPYLAFKRRDRYRDQSLDQ
ncbi:MAG: AI-2E family transporter [Leptolyngbyaceae cyanobacterium]